MSDDAARRCDPTGACRRGTRPAGEGREPRRKQQRHGHERGGELRGLRDRQEQGNAPCSQREGCAHVQASAARRGRGGEEGEERDLGDDDDRERQPCQGGSAVGVDEHTGQHRTEGRSRGERAGEDPDPQRAAAWWHDPLRQRQCEGKHAAGETLQGAGEDQLGEGRRGSGEEESERDDRKDEEQDAPRRVIVAKPADNRCGDRRDDERRGEHPGGVCGCRAEELGGGGERGCRHRQRESRAVPVSSAIPSRLLAGKVGGATPGRRRGSQRAAVAARIGELFGLRSGLRDVAQLGSALDWGSRGRRFKSCHPDRRDEGPARMSRAFMHSRERIPR